eukprot:TRINITY_DN13746_c1_g1_i1.p2 TRINITY_DN13746_c1_g1~~TRINITY_DN13746_c1_g1_i1.p2  ORF type:complete len:252 (-),score=-18.48 TRINITY_DN13746_c1_g1_i1:22-777(-)
MKIVIYIICTKTQCAYMYVKKVVHAILFSFKNNQFTFLTQLYVNTDLALQVCYKLYKYNIMKIVIYIICTKTQCAYMYVKKVVHAILFSFKNNQFTFLTQLYVNTDLALQVCYTRLYPKEVRNRSFSHVQNHKHKQTKALGNFKIENFNKVLLLHKILLISYGFYYALPLPVAPAGRILRNFQQKTQPQLQQKLLCHLWEFFLQFQMVGNMQGEKCTCSSKVKTMVGKHLYLRYKCCQYLKQNQHIGKIYF